MMHCAASKHRDPFQVGLHVNTRVLIPFACPQAAHPRGPLSACCKLITAHLAAHQLLGQVPGWQQDARPASCCPAQAALSQRGTQPAGALAGCLAHLLPAKSPSAACLTAHWLLGQVSGWQQGARLAAGCKAAALRGHARLGAPGSWPFSPFQPAATPFNSLLFLVWQASYFACGGLSAVKPVDDGPAGWLPERRSPP